LAEFFGDFMVVNGKIWPKADVEPREYRLRLLNACDSRFLVIQFVAVELSVTSPSGGQLLVYTIVGGDGGLGSPRQTSRPLVIEPGARYDIVIDFGQTPGKRVILKNLASDAPFGGYFGDANAAEDLYEDRFTDRIMAFDIDSSVPATPVLKLDSFPGYSGVDPNLVSHHRHVALFEGLDEFGRLQPLLGSRDTIFNERGIFPAYTWSQPSTEVIKQGATEEWFIYNFSADGMYVRMCKLF
jgi:FtsP/CotA-like multicopper oxidase with cupredoxin domain